MQKKLSRYFYYTINDHYREFMFRDVDGFSFDETALINKNNTQLNLKWSIIITEMI